MTSFDTKQNFEGNGNVETIFSSQRLDVCLITRSFSIDAKEKVIIDTDPGVDDSQAILFALASDEIEVVGLTSIFGNVDTGLATRNVLRLLDLVDANIPVAAGSVRPLYAEETTHANLRSWKRRTRRNMGT